MVMNCKGYKYFFLSINIMSTWDLIYCKNFHNPLVYDFQTVVIKQEKYGKGVKH